VSRLQCKPRYESHCRGFLDQQGVISSQQEQPQSRGKCRPRTLAFLPEAQFLPSQHLPDTTLHSDSTDLYCFRTSKMCFLSFIFGWKWCLKSCDSYSLALPLQPLFKTFFNVDFLKYRLYVFSGLALALWASYLHLQWSWEHWCMSPCLPCLLKCDVIIINGIIFLLHLVSVCSPTVNTSNILPLLSVFSFQKLIHNYRWFDASLLVNTGNKVNNEDFLSRVFFLLPHWKSLQIFCWHTCFSHSWLSVGSLNYLSSNVTEFIWRYCYFNT
jgi:hypothetical protein